MTCDETLSKLNCLNDSELELFVESEVRAHLNECTGCSAELKRLERVTKMLDNMEEYIPGQKFNSSILSKIRNEPGFLKKLAGVFSYISVFVIFSIVGGILYNSSGYEVYKKPDFNFSPERELLKSQSKNILKVDFKEYFSERVNPNE